MILPLPILLLTLWVSCPQRTWEDPTFVHPDAEGCRGDNDPVDVCEIGSRIVGTGVSTRSTSDHIKYLTFMKSEL